MQTTTSKEVVAGGIDQRYYPEKNHGSLVQNFRYDPNGGWVCDRGWEPLTTNVTELWNPSYLPYLYSPVRFLQVLGRHMGNEEYYVFERNGNLMYQFGNYPSPPVPLPNFILDENRNIPNPDDPGTQAIPYGRFTLFINGYDDMIKWWGRKKIAPFGFTQPPPTPIVYNVENYYAGYTSFAVYPYDLGSATLPTGGAKATNLNGVALQFFSNDCTGVLYTDSNLGLGSNTAGASNSYSYKVSYVTDTGSESPLSDAVTVAWDIVPDSDDEFDQDRADGNQRRYAVYLSGLEPGPDGVVARRIYRTKNKGDGTTGAGDVYYFVAQINENMTATYVDVKSDLQLVLEAPSVADSSVISSGYKYGASWNGSMWLAGGEANPTKIIYSKPGLPEQFGAFDYFDVGVREGGHITAVYPYYDVLLVFRERSIDAVFVNAQGNGYSCTTINKDIGTTATNTIKLVPGFGVMFLNKDGFWLLKGGLRGGASIKIENMSPMLELEMGSLAKNALPRATAAYSEREKEYWCHYPVDGQTDNTRGAVFNIVNFQWSFRGRTQYFVGAPEWSFTQLATDQSGYFIIGTKPGLYDPVTPAASDSQPGLGLQVWSGAPTFGYRSDITVGEQQDVLVTTENGQTSYVWESTWDDFGDDSIKKRILSIEAEIITGGNRPIYLLWGQDWDYKILPIDGTPSQSPVGVPQQKGEIVGTTKEQATYYYPVTPIAAPFIQGNVAKWDSSKWENQRPTRVRWDVNTGLIDQFKFYLYAFSKFQLIKFQINYIVGGGPVRTINVNQPGAYR